MWYLVDLVLAAKTPCLLAGWSGSFAYRLLLELLRRAAEPKDKVYAHPLYLNGRPIPSGADGKTAAVEPGASFTAKAVVSQHRRAAWPGRPASFTLRGNGPPWPPRHCAWRRPPFPGGGGRR
ncbi:MAG: hypothetical protein QXP31_07875 [Pyrobaculum sp.]